MGQRDGNGKPIAKIAGQLGLFVLAAGLLVIGIVLIRSAGHDPGPAPATIDELTASSMPNIVFVVLDTLRYDFTSLDPQSDNQTPNLAKLASQAIVFNNAYSTYDWTLPSHFSMMTGLEHWRSPSDNKAYYDLPENSLVFHLGELGYFSLGVAANGLLTRDAEGSSYLSSFDVFVDFWKTHGSVDRYWNDPLAAEKVDAILDRYDAPLTERNIRLLLSSGDVVVDTVDSLLQVHLDRPLFLFINLMDAHDPYFPSANYYDLESEPPLLDFYSDLYTRYIPPWEKLVPDEDQLRALEEKWANSLGRWESSIDLSEKHIERYRQRYAGSVRYLDAQLGRLFVILEQRGVLDNSIVIVTSDHGEAFGEDEAMQHSTLRNLYAYEQTHHVPLLIIPELKQTFRGVEIEQRISLKDIVPTLHEVLGVTQDRAVVDADPDNSVGTSFLSLVAQHFRQRTDQYATVIKQNEAADQGYDEETRERLRSTGYLE